MVAVDQEILEQYLDEIRQTEELQGCQRFVENFFGTVGNQTLEQAYWNYMNDILRYAPTNRCINQNRTYLCWVFKEVTGADLETLAAIEYRHHGGPDVYWF